jgi:hypothetical protein
VYPEPARQAALAGVDGSAITGHLRKLCPADGLDTHHPLHRTRNNAPARPSVPG